VRVKVLRQLLREFWLPLLLGVVWTAYNVIAGPRTDWTVRHTLNVLGPTFFFISWLVAQWYRVRKQQRVEDELSEIQSGVRALQEPLLPCGIFLTLALRADEEDVKRVFGDQPGYRAYGPDKPMPPPPYGLPDGVRDGRLMHRNKYLDYCDGIVEAAGIFRAEHPGYNHVHRPIKHTVASLTTEALQVASGRNEPLLSAPAVQVELFLGSQSSVTKATPSLILKGSITAGKVVGAWALDDEVFVDLFLKTLPPTPPANQSYSSRALQESFIRVTLEFFYLEGISDLPRESWPTLQNLQLWVGGRARHLLTFSPEQLASQITREDPDPIVHGHAKCAQLVFETTLSADTFATSFLAVS
jgi:hypothetical protein